MKALVMLGLLILAFDALRQQAADSPQPSSLPQPAPPYRNMPTTSAGWPEDYYTPWPGDSGGGKTTPVVEVLV